MAIATKRAHRKSVTANTEDYDPVVIPNGETWHIESFMGSANPYNDTHVALIWDYQGTKTIKALAYNTAKFRIDEQVTGDGSKELALVLVNDSANDERLSAEFIYKVI